jgi:hypothetical protein
MVDPADERNERRVTGPGHDRERSLSGRRQERSGREYPADLARPSQTREPGHGKDGGIDGTGPDQADPGFDVPSDLDHADVRSPAKKLSPAA